MLRRLNTKDNLSILNLGRTKKASRVALPAKNLLLIRTGSCRKTRTRRSRRARRLEASNTKRKFMLGEDLGKDVIREIQYSSLVSTILSPERRVFNEERDHSMEIVDCIKDQAKESKTVKFENKFENQSTNCTKKGQGALNGLKSYLRKRDQARTGKKMIPVQSGIQRQVRSTKFSSLKNKKLAKKLNLTKAGEDTSSFNFSKPGSVTSLFTASSVTGGATGKLRGTGSWLNPCSSESKFGVQEYGPELGEREIIQCIEEKLSMSEVSSPSAFSTKKPQRRKMFRDMYLISEIEGDAETSKEISSDKSMHTASYHSSTTKSEDAGKSTEKVMLKTNESTLKGKKARKDVREFPCFSESSVVKFKGIKPMKLPYNLIKGDDDEDSEEEDVSNGKGYLQLHLEKVLMEVTKPSRRFYN